MGKKKGESLSFETLSQEESTVAYSTHKGEPYQQNILHFPINTTLECLGNSYFMSLTSCILKNDLVWTMKYLFIPSKSQVRSNFCKNGAWHHISWMKVSLCHEFTNPQGPTRIGRKENCPEKTMWRDRNNGAVCISTVWAGENVADLCDSSRH